MISLSVLILFFSSIYTSSSYIYPLSLHDALPVMFKSLAVTSSGFSRLCTPRIAQVKLSLILNTCSGVGGRIVIAVKSSPAQANFLRIRSAARGSSRRCEGTRDEVVGERGAHRA